jgi:signal transduction histidine kinase/ActR/RegA family two-component response regulator
MKVLMIKKLIPALWCILFSISVSFSQEDSDQSYKVPKYVLDYNLQELDSLSRQMLKYFNEGFYEKILEQAPGLIKNAQDINAYDLELRFRSALGNSFIQLDDIENASIYFNQALEVAKKKQDTLSVLMMYVNLGNTYFKKDRNKAAAYLKKGAAYQYKGERCVLVNFIIHNNLAELYVGLKQPKLARYHLSKIVDKMDLEELAPTRDAFLGSVNYVKSGIYLLEDEPEMAITYALESLLYQDANDENYRIGNYKSLMMAYERIGKYEMLPKIHEVYDSLKEMRYQKDKMKQQQIARRAIRLDKTEQDLRASQLKNDLATQKASRSKLVLLFFIIMVLLLLLVSGFLLKAKNKRDRLLKGLKVKNKQYLNAKVKSEKLAQSNTRFLSTISHELRTPLYGIVGLSASFLNDPTLFKYKEEFKSLKFSADYLLALVNDVLHINKFSSKEGRKLKEVHFNLYVLLENIIKSFTFLNEKNNNKVSIDLEAQIPEILFGDKTKISQVLMNLMSNASKFTEDGTIVFHVQKLDKNTENFKLLFEIKDSGRGIHPDNQEKVLEEFTQVEESYDHEINGTGLGLPIVNKILIILGSSLHMDSIYNKGTTISFILDAHKGKKEQIENEIESRDISSLKNKKILIVDDNRINQLVTQKVLEQHFMTHETASNGKEAVEMVHHTSFDFILMDINMPVMNGIEATQKIRQFDSETPIIALTATDFEDPENEVYCYGINSIIVKPYEIDHLLQSLLQELKELQEL